MAFPVAFAIMFSAIIVGALNALEVAQNGRLALEGVLPLLCLEARDFLLRNQLLQMEIVVWEI